MTPQGKATFAHQLKKFSDIPGAVSQDLIERLVPCPNLEDFLKSKPFVIHKSCYDSFNEHMYQRAIGRKRSSSNESSDITLTQPMKTRHQSGETVAIGKQLCMHCEEPDKFDPRTPNRNKGFKLCAAAGKKATPE